MARDQRLNVDITATDRASAEITDVARKVERLDGETADVTIDADTAGVEGGIAGIADALDGLGVPVGNFTGKLGGLASPGGAIAAIVGGLVLAADAAADMAVEADNLATLTGDSVEYASRLNTVWQQTGADTKDLQDVMLQMNGVLATNADLAAELGINLNDGATIGQRFEQVSAALDLIPDAARRSQIASQVFGEEGVRQYNAMKNAVGDLSDAMDAVPDGMVVSAEDVERARETKRAMSELKIELQAFAASIGTVVIPAISGAVEGLNDLFDAAEETGRGLRRFFDSAADENWAIVDELNEADQAAADFDRTLLDGLTTFADVRAKVLELTDSEHAANVVALEWNETQKEQQQTHDDLIAAYYRGIYAIEESTEATEDEEEAVRDLTDEYNEQRDRIDDLIGKKVALVGGDLAVRQAQRDARTATDELTAALDTEGMTLGELAPLIDNATEANLNAAQAAADRRAAEMEANGSLVDAKVKNQLLKEELQRLANQFTGPLRDAILGYIADLESIPDSVETRVVMRPIAPNSHYARGTNNAARGLAIVGEEGPELVNFKGGETVTPASQTASMLSGGSSGGGAASSSDAAPQFNIVVHAGIGTNGLQVGRQIVEALEAWARSGGRFSPTLTQRLGG